MAASTLLPWALLCCAFLAFAGGAATEGGVAPTAGLRGAIPGRPASVHYSAWLKSAGQGQPWAPVYVAQTASGNSTGPGGAGYFSHLDGWTASWVSLELPPARAGPRQGAGGVLLRVQRRRGGPVTRARVHPASSGASVVAVDAKGALLSVPGPSRFTVDFDGGMDEVDTGPSYRGGPPVHTLSVFVNPFMATPDPADASVLVIRPGDDIPTRPAPNTTLFFTAGVHRVPRNRSSGWRVYELQSDVRYFLAANAVLHSALTTPCFAKSNITLEGYGILSGEDMSRNGNNESAGRCSGEQLVASRGTGQATGRYCGGGGPNNSPQGLSVCGVSSARVTGLTLVDFPNHHIIAQAVGCRRSLLRNVKVLGWRANGDGLHVFGGWRVEGLFMRTQDDTLYLSTGGFPAAGCDATTFDDVTAWNDANGASFIACGMGTRLTNSAVVYARASWAWWGGGRVFSHRVGMNGPCRGLVVENVTVEDPLPSLNAFQLQETGPASGAAYADVSFRNVHVAAASTVSSCPAFGGGCNCFPACEPGPLPYGVPNVLRGASAGLNVTNLAFVNVTLAGVNIGQVLSGRRAAGLFNFSREFVFNVTVDGMPV